MITKRNNETIYVPFTRLDTSYMRLAYCYFIYLVDKDTRAYELSLKSYLPTNV